MPSKNTINVVKCCAQYVCKMWAHRRKNRALSTHTAPQVPSAVYNQLTFPYFINTSASTFSTARRSSLHLFLPYFSPLYTAPINTTTW